MRRPDRSVRRDRRDPIRQSAPLGCRAVCCALDRPGNSTLGAIWQSRTARPRLKMSQRHQYAKELGGTWQRRARFAWVVAGLIALPFVATPFLLDLVNQVLLASIGALALTLLTGFAGLISLGT